MLNIKQLAFPNIISTESVLIDTIPVTFIKVSTDKESILQGLATLPDEENTQTLKRIFSRPYSSGNYNINEVVQNISRIFRTTDNQYTVKMRETDPFTVNVSINDYSLNLYNDTHATPKPLNSLPFWGTYSIETGNKIYEELSIRINKQAQERQPIGVIALTQAIQPNQTILFTLTRQDPQFLYSEGMAWLITDKTFINSPAALLAEYRKFIGYHCECYEQIQASQKNPYWDFD